MTMRLSLVACGENVVLSFMSMAQMYLFIRSESGKYILSVQMLYWQLYLLSVLRYSKKIKIYGFIMKEMKLHYAIFYSLSSWFCQAAGTSGKAFLPSWPVVWSGVECIPEPSFFKARQNVKLTLCVKWNNRIKGMNRQQYQQPQQQREDFVQYIREFDQEVVKHVMLHMEALYV